ncbi:hypothetical protein M0R72_00620 [Candidatus Pacearchaeota archaeon]|jgi:hypothetical protein|nr:hypothetical protein [Candidatus Pacearchaeota archaeon]
MATQNDAKIKALLQTIETKKEQMGTKPRAVWRTNGVIEEKNINTISSIEVCISLAAGLLMRKGSYEKACEFLGLAVEVAGTDIDDALADLKLRVEILKWDIERKKLTALERQLKDFRSEDLKTEDALDAIMKDLG